MPDERALLKDLAGGDRDALWALWELHAPAVRRACLDAAGGNSDRVDDAVQDVLLRTWDRLPDVAATILDLRARPRSRRCTRRAWFREPTPRSGTVLTSRTARRQPAG